MSSDLAYNKFRQESGLPLKNESSRKIEKGLKRLLIIAAVVLGAEFIWLFGISPCIPLSTVEVKGFPGFDGAAVLEYAGIGEKASFISVNVKEAEKSLGACHLVESVRVVKRFPDRLSVYLKPRKAIALSMAMIQGQQTPVYFDKYGVVFQIGNNSAQAQQAALPVISGLVITEPSPGMRLPALLMPLLMDIAAIEEKAPALLDSISEIRINRKPFGGYDLVLYPAGDPVRILLGNNISEDTLRYILVMLDIFKEQSVQPVEIDFRSRISPYSVKEVPSG